VWADPAGKVGIIEAELHTLCLFLYYSSTFFVYFIFILFKDKEENSDHIGYKITKFSRINTVEYNLIQFKGSHEQIQ
jgi:hypothetical protein